MNVDASTGHHEMVSEGRCFGEQPSVFGPGRGKGTVAVIKQRVRENIQDKCIYHTIVKTVVPQHDSTGPADVLTLL